MLCMLERDCGKGACRHCLAREVPRDLGVGALVLQQRKQSFDLQFEPLAAGFPLVSCSLPAERGRGLLKRSGRGLLSA